MSRYKTKLVKPIPITSREFIAQILEKKEKDLSHTVLKRDEKGFCDLTQHKDEYMALLEYLRKQKSSDGNPILILNYSELRGLRAPGIYLQYLTAEHTNLSQADLSSADLSNSYIRYCDFENSNLQETNLSNSCIYDSSFVNSDLSKVNLSKSKFCLNYLDNTKLIEADLIDSNLFGNYFKKTNFSGVKNLASVNNLHLAMLLGPVFNYDDRQILEGLLKYDMNISYTPNKSELEILNKNIKELKLSARPYHVLKDAEISTIGELTQLSYKDILRYRNFGQKCLREVVDSLHKLNLDLK